jgi:phage terminase large subunit
MEHDFEVDPDKAEHIWNGAYGFGQGAILARWVNIAERTGRITRVEPDEGGAPLVISSDIGFRDTAGWWFWQPQLGGHKVLKYVGDSGFDADDWIPELQKHIKGLGLPLGKIWLPHDARAKTFQSKHTTVEKFLSAFGSDKVAVVPQTRKADQISAARTVINKCEFDKDACEDGLDGLRAWEFEFNEETGVFSREPLHNWASHPADAYSYGCVVMQLAEPPAPAPDDMRGITVGVPSVTLEEMWRDAPRPTHRI